MRYDHVVNNRLIDNLKYNSKIHTSYKKEWTEEDELLIMENMDLSLLELSAKLGRTPMSIASKKYKLKKLGKIGDEELLLYLKINNEQALGNDILKFIKNRNLMKFDKHKLDYKPIRERIRKELERIDLKTNAIVKLKLIPAAHSFINEDCYFIFLIEAYNPKTKNINIKYIN